MARVSGRFYIKTPWINPIEPLLYILLIHLCPERKLHQNIGMEKQ